MTKAELEVKLEALQKLLGEKVTEQTTYQNQINDLEKQLADLNKPKLTPMQFDDVSEAIETAIGNFEFDNEDNYSIDFGLDYDGRVHCESFSFDNAYDLHREIYEAVERLFAEAECPDEDDNQENQD
jgi:hypothetical protein|tara:strand:+ start:53 stop:433 length:381 start_codon:yes stop_codon:yes gene_type:complete